MKIIGSILILISASLFAATTIVEWSSPTDHDFGDIPQGTPVEVFFNFKNIHDEAIIIDNIRTTCGCTAPDWSFDPVESDSTSHIKITYDARKTGYFRKKIKVFFNAKRKAEILYVEGFVEEKE